MLYSKSTYWETFIWEIHVRIARRRLNCKSTKISLVVTGSIHRNFLSVVYIEIPTTFISIFDFFFNTLANLRAFSVHLSLSHFEFYSFVSDPPNLNPRYTYSVDVVHAGYYMLISCHITFLNSLRWKGRDLMPNKRRYDYWWYGYGTIENWWPLHHVRFSSAIRLAHNLAFNFLQCDQNGEATGQPCLETCMWIECTFIIIIHNTQLVLVGSTSLWHCTGCQSGETTKDHRESESGGRNSSRSRWSRSTYALPSSGPGCPHRTGP